MFGILLVTLFGSVVLSEPISPEPDPEPEPRPLSDDFIDLVNAKQSSWRAGRNFAEDTPLENLIKLLGVIKSNNSVELEEMEYPPEMLENLPEEFDPRTKWTNCPTLNDIRDQGACGSCWAFGAVEAMTDRYCILSNGTKQFYFSAQDVLTCCNECGDCDGGDSQEAWNYWVTDGIVSGGGFNSKQGCRPYDIPSSEYSKKSSLSHCSSKTPTPECKPNCIEEYKISYDNDKRHGKDAFLISNDENKIKAELYHRGPVEASFAVYVDFFHYKSGVYIHTQGALKGHHAVKLLGWGVERNQKYWLLANSWSPTWGDNEGFFKILRGKNHCGIENKIVAGTPIIPN